MRYRYRTFWCKTHQRAYKCISLVSALLMVRKKICWKIPGFRTHSFDWDGNTELICFRLHGILNAIANIKEVKILIGASVVKIWLAWNYNPNNFASNACISKSNKIAIAILVFGGSPWWRYKRWHSKGIVAYKLKLR